MWWTLAVACIFLMTYGCVASLHMCTCYPSSLCLLTSFGHLQTGLCFIIEYSSLYISDNGPLSGKSFAIFSPSL